MSIQPERIIVGIPWWAIALIIAALVGITYWHYRSTNPPTESLLRTALAILRGVALIVALTLLARPFVQWTVIKPSMPRLPVFVDLSKSMTLKAKGRTRGEKALAWWQTKGRQTVGPDASSPLFGFGSKVNRLNLQRSDSVSFSEERTDLASVFSFLQDSLAGEDLAGALVLTDGAYTSGPEPGWEAEQAGVPIYVVGFGDTTEKRDLAIAEAIAPEVGYVGRRANVNVVVKKQGYENPRLEILLKKGSATLDRHVLRTDPTQSQARVRLTLVPQHTGLQEYAIEVPHLEGESTYQNNEISFHMQVYPSKKRILLIGGIPTADFGFMRRELLSDSTVDLMPTVEVTPGNFTETSFLSLDSLSKSVDGAILLDFPSRRTPNEKARTILEAIKARGLGLVVFAGDQFNWDLFTDVFDNLTTKRVRSIFSRMVYIMPVSGYALHPLNRFSDTESECLAQWQELPPVKATAPESRGRVFENCERILSVHSEGGGSWPVAYVREGKSARLAIFTFSGFWRWRLAPIGFGKQPVAFTRWVRNITAWLTQPEGVGQFMVGPLHNVFPGEQAVRFKAFLFDAGYQPINEAQITVDIEGPQTKERVVLAPSGGGSFEGEIPALPAGKYRYTATARAGDRLIGPQAGEFAVNAFSEEVGRTRAQPEVLRRIAALSGGAWAWEQDDRDLLNKVRANLRSPTWKKLRREYKEAWSAKQSRWLLLMLLTALFAEWTVRRRKGLL